MTLTKTDGRNFHTYSQRGYTKKRYLCYFAFGPSLEYPLLYVVLISIEFAGQILRTDGDQGIFLDVVWLSSILSPILDHKLAKRPFSTGVLNSHRDSLIHRGVLRWDFALELWEPALTSAGREIREDMVEAAFRVLIKLGVIIPLGQPVFSADDRVSYSKDTGMLVIMRLREECTGSKKDDFDKGLDKALGDDQEVKLKWEFGSAGAPYGLVERLIASCHVIGEVEQRVCWRYGALFKSHERTERDKKKVRLFKFAIFYSVSKDDDHDDLERILTLRMIGDLKNHLVWAALRYVASTMIMLSKEWPGMEWSGWPDCPEHPSTRLNLTPPGEVGREPKAGSTLRRCSFERAFSKLKGRIYVNSY